MTTLTHDPAIPAEMIVWSLTALERCVNRYGTTRNTVSASEHAGLAWWWLSMGECEKAIDEVNAGWQAIDEALA